MNSLDLYPRISIVTPVFNRVNMLEQTILSVLNQNYPNLEYIIIDGGSIDGTVDIIKKYEDRLAYWVSEPDNGMYHAIQKGFEKATGDIMAWINSDDLYHDNSLFIVGQIFSQFSCVDWITGTPTLYNADGICVKTFSVQFWSWERFKHGDFRWIQQESTFFRRSLYYKVGGLNLQYRLAADFDLWCKMFQQSVLYSVNTILGGFRLHGNQLSIEQNARYEEEVANVCHLFSIPIHSKRFLFRWKRYLCKRRKKNIYYDFKEERWSLC